MRVAVRVKDTTSRKSKDIKVGDAIKVSQDSFAEVEKIERSGNIIKLYYSKGVREISAKSSMLVIDKAQLERLYKSQFNLGYRELMKYFSLLELLEKREYPITYEGAFSSIENSRFYKRWDAKKKTRVTHKIIICEPYNGLTQVRYTSIGNWWVMNLTDEELKKVTDLLPKDN